LFWSAHFCMTEQNNLEENQIQLTKLIQQGLIPRFFFKVG